MKKIDMSENAVERRLRQVDQLHELSLSLMKAGRDYYEKMNVDSRERSQALTRFKKYLV